MRLNKIIEVSKELTNSLQNIPIEDLNLSPAGLSYFKFNLQKIEFNNQSNTNILNWLLDKIPDQDLSQLCFIDHGAGIGFFGLLAKKFGIGKIVCHDISKDMIEDCQKISEFLGLGFDHYVLGEEQELLKYCLDHNLMIHGLASRNVIEHIPDLNQFFQCLYKLPGNNLILVITTSANIHNLAVKLQHQRIHSYYENVGVHTDMMKGGMDRSLSGKNVRRKIILELMPDINTTDLEACVLNTRALRITEIHDFLKRFKESGKIPDLKEKLSNTLDPYSGTWVERLVYYKDYQSIAKSNGFITESLPGFYNEFYSSKIARLASKILNRIIIIFPLFHRNLAPFLVIRCIRFPKK